jgi:hypothetical protein
LWGARSRAPFPFRERVLVGNLGFLAQQIVAAKASFLIGEEDQWMRIEGKSAGDLNDVLTHRRRVTFKHMLAEAA